MDGRRLRRPAALAALFIAVFGWPLPHIHAREVAFANPPWAKEQQMVVADAVDIALDLPQLLRQNIVIPEVWLERPVVFLEQGSEGR